MSYSGQVKFEPFTNAGAVLIEEEDYQEKNDMFPLHQEQMGRRNNQVSPTNFPFEHQQKLLQLDTTGNNKTVICRYALSLVLFISLVFLLAFAFFIMVAFIVKCDESKLINHYEQRKTNMEKAISDFSVTSQLQEMDKEKDYMSQKIQWISHLRLDKNLLLQMESAGMERSGASYVPFFVGRTSYGNGTVVGKCHKDMWFGYNGTEHYMTSDFEVLLYPPGALSWIQATADTVPAKEFLVLGGHAPVTGESTYICRIEHGTDLVVGKYLSSSGVCLAPYWSLEHRRETFEIFVVNELGRLMGVES